MQWKNWPTKEYNLVYADPPWQYNKTKGRGVADNHYGTLGVDQLKQLPVPKLCATDCALLLWVTGPMLEKGLELMEHWGFEFKTIFLTWVKTKQHDRSQPSFGLGGWTRSSTEVCLLGTKGNPKRFQRSKSVQQTILEPRREHSRKPDDARERIDQFFDATAKKVELFAREQAPGWDAWGNQVGKFPSKKGNHFKAISQSK